MRLLVSVTVLYLVTSGVYSVWTGVISIIPYPKPKCPPCVQSQCVTPVLCKGGKVKESCGCCTVCAKVMGEKCDIKWPSVKCDRGLVCEKTPDPSDLYAGICSTPRKSQYFWVDRFGLKVVQLGLTLDKFVFFLTEPKWNESDLKNPRIYPICGQYDHPLCDQKWPPYLTWV